MPPLMRNRARVIPRNRQNFYPGDSLLTPLFVTEDPRNFCELPNISEIFHSCNFLRDALFSNVNILDVRRVIS